MRVWTKTTTHQYAEPGQKGEIGRRRPHGVGRGDFNERIFKMRPTFLFSEPTALAGAASSADWRPDRMPVCDPRRDSRAHLTTRASSVNTANGKHRVSRKTGEKIKIRNGNGDTVDDLFWSCETTSYPAQPNGTRADAVRNTTTLAAQRQLPRLPCAEGLSGVGCQGGGTKSSRHAIHE